MKIIVMGAGAVGGYFGARLVQAAEKNDLDVRLIARGEHLARIRSEGLLVKGFEGDFTVRPQATDDPSSLGTADLILSCVKTYDLEASLARPGVSSATSRSTSRSCRGGWLASTWISVMR
jgi:2-dehydropantoate 2-reductase